MEYTFAPIERDAFYPIDEAHLAKYLSADGPGVLSTPAMIQLMEHTCRIAVDEQLPKDYTSVGTRVSITHLAPAPKGATIRVHIQLTHQDRRRLQFQVEAWWNTTKIGEGDHERFLVHLPTFHQKLQNKLNASK